VILFFIVKPLMTFSDDASPSATSTVMQNCRKKTKPNYSTPKSRTKKPNKTAKREPPCRSLGMAAFQELIDKRSPERYDAIVQGVVATNPGGQQFLGKLGFAPYSLR